MKTAGIIGGLDFIGCDITLKFLSEGYRIKILNFRETAHRRPVVLTGLKAGNNLQVFSVDMDDLGELANILSDCDCLIHCGRPLKLNVPGEVSPVYIPLISHTGNLLKALSKNEKVGKIIFISSVGDYIKSYSNSSKRFTPGKTNPVKSKPLPMQQALYHSGQILNNMLMEVSGNRIQIFIVSPVVADNNLLRNSRESTLAGLQYLFGHKMEYDSVFQKLVRLIPLDTMIGVNDLPDKVFNSAHSIYEFPEVPGV